MDRSENCSRTLPPPGLDFVDPSRLVFPPTLPTHYNSVGGLSLRRTQCRRYRSFVIILPCLVFRYLSIEGLSGKVGVLVFVYHTSLLWRSLPKSGLQDCPSILIKEKYRSLGKRELRKDSHRHRLLLY